MLPKFGVAPWRVSSANEGAGIAGILLNWVCQLFLRDERSGKAGASDALAPRAREPGVDS